MNVHQLPNEVHQLHGRRSPTLPSMFTNLSQKFTKFHQRTTEDQQLIVEFHELFRTMNVPLRIKNLPLNFTQLFSRCLGMHRCAAPLLPVFRFFCVQDFHLLVTLHFLCHDDQAYHGLQQCIGCSSASASSRSGKGCGKPFAFLRFLCLTLLSVRYHCL